MLKNLLHITRKREMDVIEAERYALVQPKLMNMFTKDHRFTARIFVPFIRHGSAKVTNGQAICRLTY